MPRPKIPKIDTVVKIIEDTNYMESQYKDSIGTVIRMIKNSDKVVVQFKNGRKLHILKSNLTVL